MLPFSYTSLIRCIRRVLHLTCSVHFCSLWVNRELHVLCVSGCDTKVRETDRTLMKLNCFTFIQVILGYTGVCLLYFPVLDLYYSMLARWGLDMKILPIVHNLACHNIYYLHSSDGPKF